MPATPRRSQLRIAYSSTFATQVDFDTPLSNGALDAVFSLSDEEPRLEFLSKDEQIKDCTSQYIVDEAILSRSCRLTFGIWAEAETLFGVLGWWGGIVAGSEVTMLGPTEFQPPVTTLIYGHDGSDVDPLKLVSMLLAKVTIRGRVNERINVSLEFRGSADAAAATGYTFPDCSEIAPIYLKDGAFIWDGDDYQADTREFTVTLDNRPLAEEDPFTSDSIDIQRMERADERQNDVAWTVFGEAGDALELASRTNPKTKSTLQIRVGAASDGVQIDAASAILKQNGGEKHDGEARRAVLDLLFLPVRIPGNADTPLIFTLLT